MNLIFEIRMRIEQVTKLSENCKLGTSLKELLERESGTPGDNQEILDFFLEISRCKDECQTLGIHHNPVLEYHLETFLEELEPKLEAMSVHDFLYGLLIRLKLLESVGSIELKLDYIIHKMGDR